MGSLATVSDITVVDRYFLEQEAAIRKLQQSASTRAMAERFFDRVYYRDLPDHAVNQLLYGSCQVSVDPDTGLFLWDNGGETKLVLKAKNKIVDQDNYKKYAAKLEKAKFKCTARYYRRKLRSCTVRVYAWRLTH